MRDITREAIEEIKKDMKKHRAQESLEYIMMYKFLEFDTMDNSVD